ncbi:MAG: hypothetical protein IPL61_06745 [Myxococcales bacterium]|nr:hypothetical protein [Myxococcales bacterium]
MDRALAAYLEEKTSLEEMNRWMEGLELVRSIRVARLAGVQRCTSPERDPASVRVRWDASTGDFGMRLTSPVILTPLSSQVADCLQAALAPGVSVDPVELGGPLPPLDVKLIMAVPTVVDKDLQTRLDEFEAAIAARREGGQAAARDEDSSP